MKWTTAEVQTVIAKALVKNIEVIPCCMGEAKQLFCGDCDKYIDCKQLLPTNAPACKIYKPK